MTAKGVRLLAFVMQCMVSLFVSSALAAQCEKTFADVFETVSPSVVIVTAITVDPYRLTNRVTPKLGSGFLIEPGDLIITNSHVVYGASMLVVQSKDGKQLSAKLAGADPVLDLAVLRVQTPSAGLRPLRLGDSDALRVGDEVMAVGNSLGLGQTATVGVVSGLNRVLPLSTMSYLQPFIQTDAAINPGNSGGPLVTKCAEAIGINTMMLKEAQTTGFAVPANLLKQVIPELLHHGRVVRPWHGIYGRIVDPIVAALLQLPIVGGFLIETVEPGSPAEQVGLKGGTLPVPIGMQTFLLGGDVVTEVDNTKLTDMTAVLAVLNSFKVGQVVNLKYFRPGQGFQTAEATLIERPVLPGDLPR
ncbi:MAG: trypsin-like peptidase domain-containing protein [Pseudolabrys sp.]